MARPRAHIPALDGLRALAILAVIIHNTTLGHEAPGIVAKLWTATVDAGWVGVQLFFVLSGFLITGILLDGRDDPGALRTFYVRRSLRIFPLYYLFLAGRFLILPLFVPALAVGASTQIGYWLYVSNWSDRLIVPVLGLGHFWSLAVEEQFYLTWPFVVRALRPRTFAWVCGAIAVIALVVRIALSAANLDYIWLYASTITRADGLALGALVALAARSNIDATLYAGIRGIAASVAFAGLAIVMVFAHGLSRKNPAVETIGYTLLAVLFAAVIADVALPESRRLWGWLEARPLRVIGRYSYAMYVFHLPLRYAVEHAMARQLAAATAAHPVASDIAWVAAMTIGSFALAALSYVVVERPFLRLKDRWAPS